MIIQSYTQWVRAKTPRWLSSWYGRAYLDVYSTILDATQAAASDAVMTRAIARRTVDGLAYGSSDRGVARATNETTEDFRGRLVGAWRYWSNSGSVSGLVANLAEVGFTATIDEPSVLHTPMGHYRVNVWSYPAGLFTSTWAWGDGNTWGDGHTWGGFDPYMASVLQSIIRDNRPAYGVVDEIRVYVEGSVTEYITLSVAWVNS